MSDQGPVPERRDEQFGLIETLLWTQGEGYYLLAEHLARLANSSATLGFACNAEAVAAALAKAVTATEHPHLRVRLVLSRDGAIETSVTPITPVPPTTIWRVSLAQKRFRADDPMLRHKTTRRALYEDALARAVERDGVDEILFLNEHDEICEGARVNFFVPRGDRLITPPLSCGLLPGTLRARLIAEGRAIESVLALKDLPPQFYLGNSVRGLVRATLIA
jgi:branched-subunit amino acid aminotransferase/4-amino-4-deoxychorismate lyase